MATMANSSGSNGLYLCLLHGHHIEGLLWSNSIQYIVVGSLLSTEIRIVIIQSIQNLAECLVEARV